MKQAMFALIFTFFKGQKSHDKSKIHFNTFGGLIFRCIFLDVDGPVTKGANKWGCLYEAVYGIR